MKITKYFREKVDYCDEHLFLAETFLSKWYKLDFAVLVEIQVLSTHTSPAVASRLSIQGIGTIMVDVVPLFLELNDRRMNGETMVGGVAD